MSVSAVAFFYYVLLPLYYGLICLVYGDHKENRHAIKH